MRARKIVADAANWCALRWIDPPMWWTRGWFRLIDWLDPEGGDGA